MDVDKTIKGCATIAIKKGLRKLKPSLAWDSQVMALAIF